MNLDSLAHQDSYQRSFGDLGGRGNNVNWQCEHLHGEQRSVRKDSNREMVDSGQGDWDSHLNDAMAREQGLYICIFSK